jgi:predicted alpha/beta hydrolase family esterase
LPLDVYYTKNVLRKDIDTDEEEDQDQDDEDYIDQDDLEEGFLILLVDSDDDEHVTNDKQESRFGSLFSRIEHPGNINERDKFDLIELITKYKNCFGTG